MKNWRDDIIKTIPMFTEMAEQIGIKHEAIYSQKEDIWIDAILIPDFLDILQDDNKIKEIRRKLKMKAFW